jgi:hypothetical protein
LVSIGGRMKALYIRFKKKIREGNYTCKNYDTVALMLLKSISTGLGFCTFKFNFKGIVKPFDVRWIACKVFSPSAWVVSALIKLTLGIENVPRIAPMTMIQMTIAIKTNQQM